MKTYNSSDLSTGKRSKILDEAAENGVIIQEKKTNGVVRREFVMLDASVFDEARSAESITIETASGSGNIKEYWELSYVGNNTEELKYD